MGGDKKELADKVLGVLKKGFPLAIGIAAGAYLWWLCNGPTSDDDDEEESFHPYDEDDEDEDEDENDDDDDNDDSDDDDDHCSKNGNGINKEKMTNKYDLEENPAIISRREWVKYITGMSEPELRKGDNIKGVIRAESVPEHNTHIFTFVNKYTKKEYGAGYFYTESVGAMQEEFEKRPGSKGVFKSCKLVADLRQDYVTNGFHFTHAIYTTQSPFLYLFPP